MHLKQLLSILFTALLAGCTSFMTAPDINLDAGYRLILHKPLVIVPETTRVFLQAGDAFPQHGLNEYEPHCSFEVRKLMPQNQTIEPDTFVVTRVQRLIEEIVWLMPVQVASLQLTRISHQLSAADADTLAVTVPARSSRLNVVSTTPASWAPPQRRLDILVTKPGEICGLTGIPVDSSPSDIFEGYHFWLYSEQQPDVMRMTCRYILTEPWNSRPPTLEEMRYSLGAYATLNSREDSLRPGQF